MTRLMTYDSHSPYTKSYETSDFAEIVEATANIGINLERWITDTRFPAMSDAEGYWLPTPTIFASFRRAEAIKVLTSSA